MSKVQSLTFEMHIEDGELKLKAAFEPNLLNPESDKFDALSEEDKFLQFYANLIFRSAVKTLRESEEIIEGSLH